MEERRFGAPVATITFANAFKFTCAGSSGQCGGQSQIVRNPRQLITDLAKSPTWVIAPSLSLEYNLTSLIDLINPITFPLRANETGGERVANSKKTTKTIQRDTIQK